MPPYWIGGFRSERPLVLMFRPMILFTLKFRTGVASDKRRFTVGYGMANDAVPVAVRSGPRTFPKGAHRYSPTGVVNFFPVKL